METGIPGMKQKLTRDDIVRIAAAQKFLLWTILLAIGLNLAMIIVSNLVQQQLGRGEVAGSIVRAVGLGSMIIALGLLVMQIVAVIRLCLALKEGWATGIYVIFQFAPCLSLILLLFLNGRATARLKEAGIRVGLLGARSSDVENYRPRQRTCISCGEPLEEDVTLCPLCGAAQSPLVENLP